MDISYYKEKYEPIAGSWYIKEQLGEGSYGKVFRIERTDMSGTYTAALKVITIPQSKKEVEDMRSTQQDENSIKQYFYNMTQKLVAEFNLMSQLKGNSNIVSYEDHQIFEHEDGIGYDVLIRMELLTPLSKRINELGEQDVIRIGIDICKALEVCQKFNIVHRDIKPENIFISSHGDYKLGDFGVAKTMKNDMTVMTTTGTYVYMAPELKKGELCGTNVDVYSLGMVMYKLLNFNREPFLPLPPVMFNFEEREQALINRMKGMPLPKPANASDRLSEIILKACEYNPQMRYESPLQMRMELENLVRADIPDIPAVYATPRHFEEEQKINKQEQKIVNIVYATPIHLAQEDLDETVGPFSRKEVIRPRTESKQTEVKPENFDDTVGPFSRQETIESENTDNKNTNYTISLVKDGKWPYEVFVFVDGEKKGEHIKNSQFDLVLPAGKHYIEIKIYENEINPLALTQKGRDKIKRRFEDSYQVGMVVSESTRIVYGKDPYAAKIAILKTEKQNIFKTVDTYSLLINRKDQFYVKNAYGSGGYAIEIYVDGSLIEAGLKDDEYSLELTSGTHVVEIGYSQLPSFVKILNPISANKKMKLIVSGAGEVVYGFDRTWGTIKAFSLKGNVRK